jgi:hypothetical protein
MQPQDVFSLFTFLIFSTEDSEKCPMKNQGVPVSEE